MLTPLVIQCVKQELEHCGPATLGMLFSFYGIIISQTEIAQAANMTGAILAAKGMRLDELNDAVETLYPGGDYLLLAKYRASLDDIVQIVEGQRLPIGVEWQGHMPGPDGELWDEGHYSAIIAIDLDRKLLFIADPEDRNTLTGSGVIDLDTFEQRWWELDAVPHPEAESNITVIEMERLLFVLVPNYRKSQLMDMGFYPISLSLMWDHATPLEPVE